MVSAQIPQHVYDEVLDYLASKASPEDILAFKASEEAEERATYLSEKNSEGTLTPDEEQELQHLLYLSRKISLLKARAAATLNQ